MMTRKERFVNELQKQSPNFTIAFKNESFLMKVLAIVLFFNTKFDSQYTTTIGSTIYFPTRVNYELRPEFSTIITLAHEFQHVKDSEKYGIWFFLGYLFPICLLPLMLLTFFVLPWWISVILCLCTVAPLPAVWRKYFELRGYTMSLFVWAKLSEEESGSILNKREEMKVLANYYAEHFTSVDYYLMWPFGVTKYLESQVDKIIDGHLEKTDDIFGKVAEALKNSK